MRRMHAVGSWVTHTVPVLLSFAVLAAGLQAADSDVRYMPLRGLFYDEGLTNSIDASFQLLNRAELGATFVQTFSEMYGPTLDPKPSRRSLILEARTFVVSMQISRASFYTVPKVNHTIDLFTPVSASIYFTNLATGEVVFTTAATYYQRATVGSSETLTPEMKTRLFLKAVQGVIAELIKKAAQQYQPITLEATAIAYDKRGEIKRIILNRGLDAGIAPGTNLKGDANQNVRVEYSARTYSIARSISDHDAASLIGVTLRARSGNKTSITKIGKHPVMILVRESRNVTPIPNEMTRQLFADALGENAPMSVVHVNPMFQQVMDSAAQQVEDPQGAISMSDLLKRMPPRFFMILEVVENVGYELPTNLEYITKRVYRSKVIGQLVDATGRILYSTIGSDEISDQVTSEMTFDSEARREISLKNALVNLAETMSREVKERRTELPVTAVDEKQVILKDQSEVLFRGQKVQFYQRMRMPALAQETMLLPSRLAKVERVDEGGTASASLFGSDANPFKLSNADMEGEFAVADDWVRTNPSRASAAPAKRITMICPGGADNLGTLRFDSIQPLSFALFATTFGLPVYDRGTADLLGAVIGPQSGFAKAAEIPEPPLNPDLCFQPVYRITATTPRCEANKYCADGATVLFGVRLKKGADVVAKEAEQVNAVAAALPQTAKPEVRRAVLESDMLQHAIKLMPIVLAKLQATPLK